MLLNKRNMVKFDLKTSCKTNIPMKNLVQKYILTFYSPKGAYIGGGGIVLRDFQI